MQKKKKSKIGKKKAKSPLMTGIRKRRKDRKRVGKGTSG
jgi:hypothetical protein